MGIDLNSLSLKQRAMLAPEPKKTHAQGILAQMAGVPEPDSNDFQQPEDAHVGKESGLANLFLTDMRRRGCHCFYSRSDAAATIERGLPDVHVMFRGADGICRGAAVELKVSGGRVKETQRTKIIEMRKLGIPVKVCWTLKDAIAFAREKLGC